MTNASDALSQITKPAMSGMAKSQGSASQRVVALLCGITALVAANFAQAAPFAYVANNSDDNVSVVDLSTGSTVTKITVGTNPLGIKLNAAGTKAYVSNHSDGTLSVIDTATNTASATITVGSGPELIAISHDDANLYVANLSASTVSFVDTATNAQTATVAVSGYPAGVAVSPAGDKLYVTEPNLSLVAVISTASKTVTSSIAVGLNPLGIVLNGDGSKAYVANYGSDSVSVIDTASGTVVASIDVGIGPNAIAINPQGTFVYVSNNISATVSVIDTTSNTVVAAMPVGLTPLGISIDSNGVYGYVTSSSEDVLYVLDLSVNIVNGTMVTGALPTYSAITSSAGLSVNLDQHGLTGTWYNPSTSGQGLLVEAYPDNIAPGQGALSAGWFTFDTSAAGGPRWYTLQGTVKATDTAAALTIYATTGGNFNAAPKATAAAVGQATLQFTDCSHGLLNYTFSDGSNRKGVMPVSRLIPNITCGTSGDNGAAASSYLLSGNWYNPATSGQGLQFDVNPTLSLIAGAWYTFAPNGQAAGGAGQRWYTFLATGFSAGSTSATAQITETTAGVFNNPAAVTRTPVGTANISFQSCGAATVAYNFTAGTNQGQNGTLNLVRVGPTPAGCSL